MKLPTVMGHSFQQIPKAEIPRSQFDLSHGWKGTFDASQLVPVLVMDTLPGDTFQCSSTFFARLQALVHPLMDNLYLDSFYFFVPNRLVWENWQKFCGEQDNPGDSTSFVIPKVDWPATGNGFIAGSVADYMGIPPLIATAGLTVKLSALPFRAYNLIWNEWFRDQNLQQSRPVSLTDGPDDAEDCGANLAPLNRGKRHDYFTSCLPWPQKGGAVSMFSAGSKARVATDTTDPNPVGVYLPVAGQYRRLDSGGANVTTSATASTEAASMWADLAGATSTSINELRQAFQIQKLLERDARGGTRYTEIVRSHFGVVSPDARLQRPEYLGGGSTPVQINSVAQTTASPASPTNKDAQGNLAGVGTVVAQGHGFVKSFTEHGYVIGMVAVRADLTYQQGVEKHFWRNTRYDFYWPALSHIGEQAVYTQEIWWGTVQATNSTVFGYQERYGEYRWKQSQVTGLFRSDATGTLEVWHLSQDFAAAPTLDSSFIVDAVPLDRAVVVPTQPHFMMDAYHKVKAARPMPMFGVPGLMDHF